MCRPLARKGNAAALRPQFGQTRCMDEQFPRLPWPIADPRSPLWGGSYADMHAIVAQLVIPDGLPQRATSVIVRRAS